MIKEQLHSERLFIRKISESDSSRLFTIWSHPEVTRYMNISPFTNERQAKEMIHFLNELALENKAIRYAIIKRASHEIIGTCGFNYIDFENDKAEIGYDLDKAFWGKGFTPEAISCLIQYAFNELNLNRIEAKVEPENINSIKVLEKLTFTFEGTLRESEKSKGTFINLNMYSKLKND